MTVNNPTNQLATDLYNRFLDYGVQLSQQWLREQIALFSQSIGGGQQLAVDAVGEYINAAMLQSDLPTIVNPQQKSLLLSSNHLQSLTAAAPTVLKLNTPTKQLVVQVLDVVDITQSIEDRTVDADNRNVKREVLAHQPGGKRMLKLIVTDGYLKLPAMELQPCTVITPSYDIIGGKLLVHNPIVRRGMLLLQGNEQIRWLGGSVPNVVREEGVIEQETKQGECIANGRAPLAITSAPPRQLPAPSAIIPVQATAPAAIRLQQIPANAPAPFRPQPLPPAAVVVSPPLQPQQASNNTSPATTLMQRIEARRQQQTPATATASKARARSPVTIEIDDVEDILNSIEMQEEKKEANNSTHNAVDEEEEYPWLTETPEEQTNTHTASATTAAQNAAPQRQPSAATASNPASTERQTSAKKPSPVKQTRLNEWYSTPPLSAASSASTPSTAGALSPSPPPTATATPQVQPQSTSKPAVKPEVLSIDDDDDLMIISPPKSAAPAKPQQPTAAPTQAAAVPVSRNRSAGPILPSLDQIDQPYQTLQQAAQYRRSLIKPENIYVLARNVGVAEKEGFRCQPYYYVSCFIGDAQYKMQIIFDPEFCSSAAMFGAPAHEVQTYPPQQFEHILHRVGNKLAVQQGLFLLRMPPAASMHIRPTVLNIIPCQVLPTWPTRHDKLALLQ